MVGDLCLIESDSFACAERLSPTSSSSNKTLTPGPPSSSPYPCSPDHRGGRPDMLFADRGYDHDKYRRLVRQRGIRPAIAERGQPHGTGLGTFRWVVERTIAWLHGFRRLRIRWERRDDIHEAFLGLAVCLITHRHVQRLC